MKITNASSKTVMLINGKVIKPKATIDINVKEGTDLYQQIQDLIKADILNV